MTRKKWISGLTISLALLLAGGLLVLIFLNIQQSNNYLAAYVRYSELVTHLEQATLTVNSGDRNVGVYTLEELGIMDQVMDAALDCFGFSVEPEAGNFAKLSVKERKAAFQRVKNGIISVDEKQLDATLVAEDLRAMDRGAGDIFPETVGAEIHEGELADVLRSAVSGWIATEDGMSSRTIDLAGHAIYTVPTENGMMPYRDVLTRMLQKLTIPVTLRDRVAEMEMLSVVDVDRDGVGTINTEALEQMVQQWAEECPAGWLPYRLESHGRDPVDLDFLHVHYALNQETLISRLTERVKTLDASPLEAEYLCTKNGKAYTVGDAYVEVDIARQKMMYYENGEMILSTDVVTGFPYGHWTWPGLYAVEEKDTDRQLIAWDYNIHVDYWVGYDGDYGIHDAGWRDVFGGDYYETDGSHGCVNTPSDAMAEFFKKIQVGMPVIVHYVREEKSDMHSKS